MKDPVDHIARSALPWRTDELTECGRPLNDVSTVVSRDEAIARWKDQGARRASLSLCMTCIETARRHPTWAQDPRLAFLREYDRYGRRGEEAARASVELRALALLVDAHADEFRETIEGIDQTVDLASRRTVRSRR